MPASKLWIDITELFGQFAVSSHPTGVSRVIINLVDALRAEPGNIFGEVRPIFWHPVWRMPLTFTGSGPGDLAAFFPGLQQRYAAARWQAPASRRGLRKGLITAVPKPLRFRLFPHLHGVTHFMGWCGNAGLGVTPVEFSRNDCLFVPGSFWLDGYAPRMAARARAAGTTVAAFVHDVLLLSHPEWMAPRHAEQFRRGVDAFLPCCSAIACNSANTRDELKKHARLRSDVPLVVCRLADAQTVEPAVIPPESILALAERRYALFVSTLTPRKNHILLVEAWQKLWIMFGPQTPWLVFAGGGAPDGPLAAALARAAACGNRVIRLTGMDDAALEALYAKSWLTLYPSLGEGYGLPAAEALARGKVCLATRCGGLADVSAELIDPIEPSDADSLVAQIAGYLNDAARLAAREAEIRTHYRPTRWSDTASSVRTMLEGALRQRG